MSKNRWVALGAIGAIAVGLVAVVERPAPGTSSPAPPDRHGRPLAFELNQGQTDPQVRFLARGQGYRAFVTPTGLTLSVDGQQALRFTPLNASPDPALTAFAPLPGKVNYLKRADPAGWLMDVPTFAQARAHDVYPGVDLVYYGADGQLEYDFVVAPGADPGAIRVAVAGGKPLALNDRGDLVIGSVVQRRPVAYQEAARGRRSVDAAYVLGPGNSFGLRLGAYDPSRPLVIDPVIAYSTYLGGSMGPLGDDEGDAIATDAAGNAYVTGRTASTDFPATAGLDTAIGGTDDAFVTKLSPAGAVLWSTYLGGTGFEQGYGIAYAATGTAVYVTGQTTSGDFPTPGGFDTTLGGAQDAFVTKLNAASGAVLWSTYLGGNVDDTGFGVAADSSGNALITGTTSSTTGLAAGGYDLTLTGASDAFVAKVLAAGGFAFATYVGGDGADTGSAIDIDGGGNAYVTGTADDPINFPLTSAFDPTLNGPSDAFVVSVSGAGALRYGSFLGGDGAETGFGIAVDAAGVAYVTGQTDSATGFPVTGGSDTTLGGAQDAFVTKISATPAIVWSTYFGGSGTDAGYAIDLDANGDPYIAGYTDSATGFPLAAAVDSTFVGGSEAFAAKLQAATSALLWSTFIGGDGDDQGYGIALTGTAAHVTGFTQSATGFPLVSAADSTLGGFSDGFVTKLAPDTTPPVCKIVGTTAGPPKQMFVSVQDTVGLAMITNVSVTNGTVFVPAFTVGTTSPIVVTATKSNQSLPTTWSFQAVDVDGNVKTCQ